VSGRGTTANLFWRTATTRTARRMAARFGALLATSVLVHQLPPLRRNMVRSPRRPLSRIAMATYLCSCIALVVLLILAIWVSYRDLLLLQQTLLEAEIHRLRSHAEHGAERIEEQLVASGKSDVSAVDDDWLAEQWRRADLSQADPRRFAAVLDSFGTVVQHTDPGRNGQRLSRGWYDRVVASLGTDVVETHSPVLTRGTPAYSVRVPIHRNGLEIGEYHSGFDAAWFRDVAAAKELSFLQRRALLIAGLMLVSLLSATSLYFLARQSLMLRRAMTSVTLQSAAEVGQLAAGLAHEIRNPLHAIQLNLHAFRRAQDHRELLPPHEIRTMLEQSSREIERIDHLVHQLLSFATPEQPRDETIDLTSELRTVVEFLDQELLRSNIEVETELPRHSVSVRMDHARLRQIMLNLLRNAQEALEHGGRIVISLRRHRGFAEISVADNGPGISDLDRQRVFEPFFSTKAQGTGLGLALARRFVDEVDGEIDCLTNEWGGTTFRIMLPDSQEQKERIKVRQA
jgi:signal transduction histidine kinase